MTALARVIFFSLSLFLSLIPASWSAYGIHFDGGLLSIDLALLGGELLFWMMGSFGLALAVFGAFGKGGKAALQRVVVYVLSPLLPVFGHWAAGFGIEIDGVRLLVSVEALATSIAVSLAVSIGIFQRWGIK